MPAKTPADQPTEGEIGNRVPTVGESSPPTLPAAPQIKVDDSKAYASYANFCRVTGTPEELIIDFSLNPQPVGIPTEPLVISQRIVTNFFTAKRLVAALSVTIQRHEAAFGVLETNIQKRITPQARGST
ncbi:MAG TPA: DUF3467 domain-containing protein [Pirellulales bacterium]|nr:DUF3467 domain-containing protein [Pirellulales bacterium]